MIFLLARFHYAQLQQRVSSWTDFNIQVHDRKCIVKSNLGYLPTMNAPATSMATINEVLNQSLRIIHSLKLTSITCVFDQALSCRNQSSFASAHSTHYVPSSQTSERSFKIRDSEICVSSQESWLRGRYLH